MSDEVREGLHHAQESSAGCVLLLATTSLIVGVEILALAALAFGLLTLVGVLQPESAPRTTHESGTSPPVAALLASTYGLIGVAVAVAAAFGLRGRVRRPSSEAPRRRPPESEADGRQ